MRILPDDFPKSGYQPQLATPPSAGRALSVLIAVCAVLWIWLMLPQWWLANSVARQNQVSHIVFHEIVVWLIISSVNIILLQYATRPMWLGERASLLEEAKRGFVLLLCLMFHLITPAFALFLLMALAMD